MIIPELTKYQVATIMGTIISGGAVFMAPEPNPLKDLPNVKEEFEQHLKECMELVSYGLAIDVSDDFKESIQLSKLQNGHGAKVFSLTEIASKMFMDSDLRSVN